MTKKSILFTEYFGIQKTQAELDFVNVDIFNDIPLFIDPWAIRQHGDEFSIECHGVISSYFENLISTIRNGDEKTALSMLDGLHEPSEIHLGHSKRGTSGSAIGSGQAKEIYEKLKTSEAVRTGYLNDLEDTALMIDGVKEDRISDIVTNLIRGLLIKYTQNQCKLLGIEMRPNTPSGYYWDSDELDWKSIRTDMLVVEKTQLLILVPKVFVRKTLEINPDEFYNIDILDFEQARHRDMASSLCRIIKDNSGAIKKINPPTKDELKKKRDSSVKEYIYTFSKANPQLLETYKRKKADHFMELSDADLDENFNPIHLANYLIDELGKINPGKADAYKYENIVSGILQFLFFPELHNPILQEKIDDGRRRIDISYSNDARDGFFANLPKIDIPCRRIYFECKNYKNDLENPEFDQMNGRFSNNISQIGFLICRKISDRGEFVVKCKDFVLRKRHFIIGLDDDDLVSLLKLKMEGKSIDTFLDRKLSEIIGS